MKRLSFPLILIGVGLAIAVSPYAAPALFQGCPPGIHCCCTPAFIHPGPPPTGTCLATNCDGDDNTNCVSSADVDPTIQVYSGSVCHEVETLANCPTRQPVFGFAYYYHCKDTACIGGGFNCAWVLTGNDEAVFTCNAAATPCN